MNKYMWIFLIMATNVPAAEKPETCISTNCDIYREEEAKFKTKLASIHCASETDTSKDCDQVELSKISSEYANKISSIFSSPNVRSDIRNDIQFNSLTNSFAAKKQNAPGYYEIISALTDPNIGVHWGAVQNNQVAVDRLVNIDPKGEDVRKSNWYLTQWKKDAALMLSSSRRDPILHNGPTVDSYLGKSIHEINSPVGKYGVETSLLIFKDAANNSNVFEIIGRNGWLNNVGGSNVFLSSPVEDQEHNSFDSEINLTFNGKLSKMKARYNDNSSETKNEVVVGQAFGAFTAYHKPTNTSLFVQLSFGDTRGVNMLYKGCYMHGPSVEIVYSHNLDNDFAKSADSESAPLKPKKYYLNKYLCNALKQDFKCPATVATPDFKGMSKNLNNWKITSLYTGVETQVAKASSSSQEVAGPARGQVEMGMQYSNMRVTANTNSKTLDCDAVLNKKPELIGGVIVPAVLSACSKGSFKSGEKTINFFCGCGEIAGASKQADGCFHKLATEVQSLVEKTPGAKTSGVKASAVRTSVKTRNPALPTDPKICSRGKYTNDKGAVINYSCGCGAVAGGALQGDGCYHFAAKKTAKAPAASYGSFCVGVKKTNWICNAGDQGEGWSNVGKGCYHRPTNESCD